MPIYIKYVYRYIFVVNRFRKNKEGESVEKIKIGDIVTRNSDNNNILFYVEDIIRSRGMMPVAILKGVTIRIEVSSSLEDIRLENKSIVKSEIQKFDNNIDSRARRLLEYYNQKSESRKIFSDNNCLIMHLDGDRKYAEKSARIYDRFRLQAIVKNIKENRQPFEIRNLLNKYNPDIVVITGHDGMIKKGYRYNDIYNYRNSKYFVKTVQEIRNWEQGENRIAVFAGACQSYYEAIIGAGANFASSPARILIDFMDPIIVAQRIANTPEAQYLRIEDIKENLRDGERGISGIGSFGKLELG